MNALIRIWCCLLLMAISGPLLAGQNAVWQRGWPVKAEGLSLSRDYQVTHREKSLWKPVQHAAETGGLDLVWTGRLGAGALVAGPAVVNKAPSSAWMQKPGIVDSRQVLKKARHRIGQEFMYGATVTLKLQETGNFRIGVSGSNPGAIQLAQQQAERILKEELDQMVQDRFLVELPIFHRLVVKKRLIRSNIYFDMAALSGHYAEWTGAVTHDFDDASNPADRSGRLLDFLQSIPYRDLKETSADRDGDGASGLLAPDQMLRHLEGDCDSKGLFWLAAMRQAFPGLPLIFIVTHNHAFVGRHIQPDENPNGTILPLGKYRFLVSEPVGPALVPEGVLSAQSADALKRGIWHYQIIHD